ncbi:MAG: hypothetical protein IT267_00410 [Saprospiraceae bacterium]|nr:hypothetical protein [Saprospiraceae bacterium]
MKAIRSNLFILLSIFSLGILTAQPCTTGNSLCNDQTTFAWQGNGSSFTYCGSSNGLINTLTFYYNTLGTHIGSNMRIQIFDGPDWTFPVLHTQVVPFGSLVVGANTITIIPPIPINVGEVNSYEITSDAPPFQGSAANGLAYCNSNVYAGGSPWWSSSAGGKTPFPNLDQQFLVGFASNTVLTPTLGQWGIIILALLFLSISSILVTQKKLRVSTSLGNGEMSMDSSSSNTHYNLIKHSIGDLIKYSFLILLVVNLIFGISVLFFNYEMTAYDIPGSLISSIILAYTYLFHKKYAKGY